MKYLRAILTVTTFFFLTFPFKSSAQILGVKRYSNDTRYDVGISLGVPITYLPKSVDVDIRYQKDYTSSLAILVDVGLTYFLQNEALVLSDFKNGALFIPVTAGAKTFLTEKLYLSGEVGAAFRVDRLSNTSFIYSPGVGFEFNRWLDLGLRYESLTKYDAAKIGLKIAYGIHFKRQPKFTSWYE